MSRNKSKLDERTLEGIIETYSADELLLSKAYCDGGLEPLWARFDQAAGNQIDEGEATAARYAIWANTVRDNLVEAMEVMKRENQEEANRLITRAVNSLSAFADVQAYCDPFEIGKVDVEPERIIVGPKAKAASTKENIKAKRLNTKKRKKGAVLLRFMEHYVIRNGAKVFAGLWVRGPDMEGDLDYAYLPEFEDELDEATLKMNDIIVEYKDKPLPADILERIASGGHLNAWGPVQETQDYGSIPELEKHVMAKKGLLPNRCAKG